MANPKTIQEIQEKLKDRLRGTQYESSHLEPLPGGSSNFVYRMTLSKPLPDSATLIIKHSEAHMAVAPENKLNMSRLQIESTCLTFLASFNLQTSIDSTPRYAVRVPRLYLCDEENGDQLIEDLPGAINLKQYFLKDFPSNTQNLSQPDLHILGKALGQYIQAFHLNAQNDFQIRDLVKQNQRMQDIRHMTNYDWLLQQIEKYPDILEDSRGIFQEVKEMAVRELQNPETLVPIHGDYWPGNILLKEGSLQARNEVDIFVVDWEMAQLGPPAIDHGEMVGEMYALWFYRKIDAGLWMIQGYADGLGNQTEDQAWRIVLQIGVHLLTFGVIAPNWGTPDQVKDLARVGKEIVVNSWKKDRSWVEGTELACFFG
ncbi:kinase-like domain-containing protein [Penicillium herquei]|nr:kinase-like domain-containing protein [Penicillium herquei]